MRSLANQICIIKVVMRFTRSDLSRGGRITDSVEHMKYLTMQNSKPLSPRSQRFYAREIQRRVKSKGRKCLVTMVVRVQMVNWHSDPINGKFERSTFNVRSEGTRRDRTVYPETKAAVIRNRIILPMISTVGGRIESWNSEGTDWTFEKFVSIHFELCWKADGACKDVAVHGSLEELPAELKSLKNVHITNRDGDGECLRLAVEVGMWWHLNPTATKLPRLVNMGYPVQRTAAILREAGDQLDWTDVAAAWTTTMDIMTLHRNNEGLFIEVIDYVKGRRVVDGVELHYPAISPKSYPEPTRARAAAIHIQLLRIEVSSDVYHYVALGPGALGAIEVRGAFAEDLIEASETVKDWCGIGFKVRELISTPGLVIGQALQGREKEQYQELAL